MQEYLTIDELSTRIKYSKQSLYNLIHKKVFELNKHYHKPTPKKILFKWSAIQEWIERDSTDFNVELPDKAPRSTPKSQATGTTISKIQI